ncbi:IS66 family insertion sequence hypothetical protein [Rheinheimera sp. D18]|uniref:IS66 family insertion sequence element accessory protein TnpA n=1 Tax=Rheinheimera sp. D18 TaxID=2545632 RepID=UPI0010461216|nr:IS66 family insertion sequence element accessory protein TnpB [Rheinheimera sp. D18]QBL09184.1 IS66 family insertion sequence hypothetical protein [Rheinheimera sp. D18]
MRKSRSLEQWRNIIEEQQASDLTIAEYCQQHALSKTTFYATKNKLSASSGHFIRAKITKQIDVIEQQKPFTLAIGNVTLSLPTTTSATFLSQLLRDLAG